MPEDNFIYSKNLAPRLWSKYFKGEGEPSNHLKVLATIANKEGHIQWAIFFGNKRKWNPSISPNGDPDFKGIINGGSIKGINWENKRPLWLIPISLEARDEALRAIEKKVIPIIQSSSLTIRNEGKGKGNWDYLFDDPIKDPKKWSTDPELILAPDTHLKALSHQGEWLNLHYKDDTESWPVWLTTKKFDTSNRQIIFSAPASHIVDKYGNYVEQEIWFGVRIENDKKIIVNYPFLSINDITPDKNKDGADCPLAWYKSGRNDDTLIPQNSKSEKLISIDWKDPCPLQNNKEAIDYGSTVPEILESFLKSSSQLHSWILQEKVNESKSDIAKKTFNPIYIRNYLAFGQLFQILGNGGNYRNFISIIQVSRGFRESLMTRIGWFAFNNKYGFIKCWNSKSTKIKEAIQETSSNGFGVVAKLEKTNSDEFSYVSEWETSADHCSKTLICYTLKATFIVNLSDPSKEIFKCKSISLPLLRPENNTSINKTEEITLNDAEFVTLGYASELINDNGTLFQLSLSSYLLTSKNSVLGKPLIIRDGSLAFTLAKNEVIKSNILKLKHLGRFRLTLQLLYAQKPLYLWEWYEGIDNIDIIKVSLALDDFSLPVNEVQAAGQDTLTKERLLAPHSVGAVAEGFGERIEPPLVIPLPQQGDQPTASGDKTDIKYLLTFSESVNVGQDYRIDTRLQEYKPEAGNDKSTTISAIILDANPQLVAKVDARFLQQPGFDDGAWVLARKSPFSEEAGGWELLDDSAGTEGFLMTIPTQAIGEAYVKGKPQGSDSIPDGEPKKGKAIEYRFGSPAILRLAPERLERRYVAVPWNLRRIYGQPGDTAPGVPLLEAQFELLYGLTGHLKPEKAYIAEVASKLGEVPVPPVNNLAWNPTNIQQESFRDSWQQYLSFYRAWQSRLAILEPSTDNSFSNTIFNTDLSFAPRITFKINPIFKDLLSFIVINHSNEEKLLEDIQTLINYIESGADNVVIDPKKEGIVNALKKLKVENWPDGIEPDDIEAASPILRIGASLKPPIREIGSANNLIYPSDLSDLEKKIIAAHNSKGLAGGFHYGFESKAIYKEFWREAFTKGSSSGEIKALALSSMGGYGNQTARFAGDKTVIRSITSMGRTHFYAVERIGRIGVFWHKAKHVIEYERTVVPSKQFMKHQPKHLGRPLVRKVREYIEILEPRREYPDFKTDIPDAPGSVTACTFKSIIIPVLSTWGHDVWGEKKVNDISGIGAIGWEVPLWNIGSDPALYPKPQVVLSLLPPPNSDEKEILYNLSDPENLWFYTDTRASVEGKNQQKKAITADVHSWPSVQNVDFSDLPEPEQYDIDPTVGESPEEMQIPMPDVPEILPVFERFTFRVDRNEIPASVAGRYYSGASITARMRTVTMMRSLYKKEDKQTWLDKGGNEIKALEALLYEFKKDGASEQPLLSRSANGFNDINKKVLSGGLVSIEEFKTKIGQDLLKVDIPNKLKNLTNIKDPGLLYLKQNLWHQQDQLEFYPFKWVWRESLEAGDGIISRVLSFYDAQYKLIKDELEQLTRSGSDVGAKAQELLDRFHDQISLFQTDFEFKADTAFSSILKIFNNFEQSVQGTIADKFNELRVLIDKLNPTGDILEIKKELSAKINEIFVLIDDVITRLFKNLKETNEKWKNEIEGIEIDIKETNKNLKDKLERLVEESADTGATFINEIRRKTLEQINFYNNQIQIHLTSVSQATQNLLKEAENGYEEISKTFKDINEDVKIALEARLKIITTAWNEGKDELLYVLKTNLDELRKEVEFVATCKVTQILCNQKDPHNSDDLQLCVLKILKDLDELFAGLKQVVITNLTEFFGTLPTEIEAAKAHLESWLETLDSYHRLKKAIKSGNKDAILSASVAMANSINKEFGRLAGEVSQKVKDAGKVTSAAEEVVQAGKQTLNNFRSVWEEFTAPGMGLNRKTVALIVRTDIKDIEQRLSITPCISRIKQFGEDLEGLGLRLPVVAITDRLLPAKEEWKEMEKSLLKKFDFSNILSDLGGMRFDKFLPGLKMPESTRENIKVTQGFEKQSLMAWVNAEADIQLTGKKNLMSIGPIQVEIENGHFTGKMRLELDIDGKTKKTNSGQLTGSWHITIAGTGLMIFRDTSVIFKDGKLGFDLDPKRMEMPGLLKMLTDATTKLSATGVEGGLGEKKEAFKVGLVKVGEIPAGVRATLDIPPVSVGGGTTAITNLCFGGHFELLALDQKLNFNFLLGFGFYLGKKDAPFNITIFLLGGGGYIDCALSFAPKEGLTIDFVMSLHASVSLAVALGWMTGLVIIMLGLEGEYHKTPKSGGSVYITIYVRVIGMVDILSLVSIYLYIGLEATYKTLGNGGTQLVGTGMVILEIRVCRFIKIKVRKAYTKVFAGSGESSISRSNISPSAPKDVALSGTAIENHELSETNPVDNIVKRAQQILNSLD